MKPNEKDGQVWIFGFMIFGFYSESNWSYNLYVGEFDQSHSTKSLYHCQQLFIHFQSSHLDDLLDSDGPCCEWEAVAKRQAKEIKQLKADISMYEQRLASDVQFVSELRKPKVPSESQKTHCGAQTDEQDRLLFYALAKGS